jgi:TP901 family phage tail tape measure protein
VGDRVNVGTMLVELLLDDSELDKGVKRSQKRLSGFAEMLRDAARSVDNTITTAFQRAGAAALALTSAAAVVGAGFERQMSKVGAVAGATSEELAALTEEARRIGATTNFSATDAAKGMEALAQAGMKPAEVITATADAMALAGANAIDLDTATSLVAATLTQFSLNADDAGRVSDVFTQAAQSSLLTVEDIASAMRYAGTAGAALGYSLEETTAALAQFRNLGLLGEQAGTNFRAMMESLANPTEKAKETLASMGIALDAIDPSLHSFDEIVQTLSDHGLELGESYKIFGSIAGGNVQNLVNGWEESKASATGYLQTLDSLNTSHGVADRSFALMADNVAGSWETLKSAAEEFFLTVFEALRGPLQRLLEGLTQRVNVLAKAFGESTEESEAALNKLVDGLLALSDILIALVPRLEEIGVAMFAALVVAKGVRLTLAVLDLSSKLGVDLVGGIGKAITALRAMGAAQSMVLVTGIGLAIAAVASLVLGLMKLADSYTGAARAARELAGQQQGQEQLAAASAAEQERIGIVLKATQDEIAARVKAGEAVSNNERALLKYTDAQAYSAMLDGEMLVAKGRLVESSKAESTSVNQATFELRQQAASAGEMADELEKLKGAYREAGVSDTMNDWAMGSETMGAMNDQLERMGVSTKSGLGAMMAAEPVLLRARELTGKNIESYEDLAAAIVESRGAQARALETGRKLEMQVAATTAETQAAAAAEKGLGDQTARTTELSADQAKELSRSTEALGAFQNWFAAWEGDSSVGEEMLGDLNEQLRDLPSNLAKVGAAAQQVAPSMVEDFSLVALNMAGVSREYQELVERMEDEAKREPFEKLREGFVRIGQDIREAGGLWKWLGDQVESAAEKMGPILLDLGKKALVGLGQAVVQVAGQIRAGIESIILPITGLVRPLFDLQNTFGNAFSQENESGKPDEMVTRIRAIQGTKEAAEGVKAFVSGFAAALPGMLSALAEALPDVLSSIIAAIPKVIDAIIEQLPVIVEALAEAIPDLIGVLAEKLPELIDAILSQLPTIIRALGDGIVLIIGMLPDLLTAILSNLPAIITALVNQLPKIIDALVAATPEIIIAIVEQIPAIVFALIKAMPKIAWAMISLVPRLIVAIIGELPRILDAFWQAFKDIWPKFTEWAGEFAKTIGEAVLDVLSLGLFKTSKEKEKGDKDKGFLWGLFDKKPKNERHADGIQWAPRTMATVLEPGEAVLTAMENAAHQRRRMNAPAPLGPAGASGDASGGATRVGVYLGDRLVDDVLVEGVARGRAPGVKRLLRDSSGRRPGYSRGRFQAFNRS